jgi:hypothetical protein
MREFRGGRGLNFHREVDPIKDGPAYAVAIFLPTTGSMTALPSRVAEIAASARVHCRDELEARWIGYVCRRPRHGRSSRFHWLAQRFQRLARKFGQFVKK